MLNLAGYRIRFEKFCYKTIRLRMLIELEAATLFRQ